MSEANTTTTTVVDTTQTPVVAKPWYDGAPAEIVGHIQTKGWHEKPANEVALAAIAAHREAEKYIGHPADHVLKLPKDAADADGWKTVWNRLGVPADAKDYDFAAVKFADGSAPTQAFTDWVRATAHQLNIPKDQAASLAGQFVKYLENDAATEATERTAKVAEEQKTLDASWGANKEANLFIAKQAAAKLGVSPEAVQALEGQVGYAAVMNMFLAVGQKIGEDKFVSGGIARDGILTREQAVARKAELMADSTWSKRYLDGDAAANREMVALLTLIVGDDTNASRGA